MLRSGGQQEFRSRDVKLHDHEQGVGMQSKLLAEIYVGKETSKVRKVRELPSALIRLHKQRGKVTEQLPDDEPILI